MIGIRDLRADLAAHIRRAQAGETTVVSVGGRPAAVLAPATDLVSSSVASGDTLRSSLLASGGLIPPRRSDGTLPTGTVPTWGSVRLDRLLAEIRG